MATVNLAATQRTKMGKQAAKQVRRVGFVPGNLYGHGMKPLALQVNSRELFQVLHTKAGENVVITLQVEGVKLKESTCLIKELQHNPISDKIDHVDFTVISLTEKIDIKVPVVIKGAEEAPGTKEGGILDVIHHEIEVECLPTEIPEKIEIDIKAMKIGDTIHLKDIRLPKGVVSKFEADEVLVALHPPAKEEEPAAAAAEGAAAPTEPEVIEKGKKPVEGEEEAKK